MRARREAREWAVQILFQTDFNPGDIQVAFHDFWSEKKASPHARKFAEELVVGTIENQAKIDALIRKFADNWDIARMGGVDRGVMRLAVYEMLFRPDIPPVVSINEAVDIARDYSGSASGKFVNGILDRIRKDLNRPARTPEKQQDRT